MNVLVTGAAGFIGSNLTRRLLEEGHEVSALVKPGSDNFALENLDLELMEVDICDFSSVKEALRKDLDGIFHLAAFTSVGRDPSNISKASKINVGGTINMLRASIDLNLEFFINTGTCEEYGNNLAPFKEDMLPMPVSPYSASKTAAWMFAESFRRNNGVPVVTLRPFLSYGPYQKSDRFLTALIASCLEGNDFAMSRGEQKREINHIDDIVEGYVLAAEKRPIGETINIGNGRPYTIMQIAEKVLELSGAEIGLSAGKIPYRKNEIWELYCDNTKAKKLLSWEAKTGLKEGIKNTLSWYRETKEKQPEIYKKLIG